MRVGYVRVSTILQNEKRQLELLENQKCDKLFIEKLSGAHAHNRPQLKAMLEFVREGDEIIVHSTDRLARNHKDLYEILQKCKDKGVVVNFISQNLSTAQGLVSELIISILGYIAQMELQHIKERQREGIEIAKRKGIYKGRTSRFDKIDSGAFKRLYELHKGNLSAVAKSLNVNRNTLYKFIEYAKPFEKDIK